MGLSKVFLASLVCVCATTLFAADTVDRHAIQSLHLDWIDNSVKPNKDFFAYANGVWQKNHPIPAAYARWGTFEILHEENLQLIKTLVVSAANNPRDKPGSIEQQVGDFYA